MDRKSLERVRGVMFMFPLKIRGELLGLSFSNVVVLPSSVKIVPGEREISLVSLKCLIDRERPKLSLE